MSGRSFVPQDTDPDAYDVQTRAYREMGGAGRTRVMFQLTEMARKNAVAGIRARHPRYDDETVRIALSRLLFGDELTGLVWPHRELPAP